MIDNYRSKMVLLYKGVDGKRGGESFLLWPESWGGDFVNELESMGANTAIELGLWGQVFKIDQQKTCKLASNRPFYIFVYW